MTIDDDTPESVRKAIRRAVDKIIDDACNSHHETTYTTGSSSTTEVTFDSIKAAVDQASGLLARNEQTPDVYLITPEVETALKDHLSTTTPQAFWATPQALTAFDRLYGIPFEVHPEDNLIRRALELYTQGKRVCIISNKQA